MNALCLLLCAFGAGVYADFYERGNAAYNAGSMDEAVSAYEQLAASGVVNPEVFYNLGNAYYHQGDLGRAVLNYERALGLRPNFAAAERNLAVAIEASAHRFERPEAFALDTWRASWVPGVPEPLLAGALLALWWGLWGILLARQGPVAARRKSAGPVCFLLALCAAAMMVRSPQIRSAVVVAPESSLRYGPDERDATRIVLAAGDRVQADRAENGWVRVETAAGVRGWVTDGAIAWIGPPFARDSTEREQGPQ